MSPGALGGRSGPAPEPVPPREPPDPYTVWLLGAGFPQPLGAPVLADLFQHEHSRDIEAFFPTLDYGDLADDMRQVQAMFTLGQKEKRWRNAEQFLAYVDEAFADERLSKNPKWNLLWAVAIRSVRMDQEFDGGPDDNNRAATLMLELDRSVRKALAAECTRFIRDPKLSTELWQPYRQWYAGLKVGRNTLVGFNYDPTVEELIGHAREPNQRSRVHVVMPDDGDCPGQVPYVKLHGSAAWVLKDKGHKKACESVGVRQALTGKDMVAIATPGASKAKFCQDNLERLWARAELAISLADRICLVGYSFPDTDPSAQNRLLEAICKQEQTCTIHVVLGPDTTSPGARRLLALLSSATGGRRLRVNGGAASPRGARKTFLSIRQHPLYSQDFLLRPERFMKQ